MFNQTPSTMSTPYKSLDELPKWELVDKCKKYRFVLQKLNKEIQEKDRLIQELQAALLKK